MRSEYISERRRVRKMYGSAKYGVRWIIRRQEEIKDIFQEANTVQLMKSRQQRWYCLERLQTQTKKRGRLTKRQRDEVEVDLNVMGLKDEQAMARNR
jgi:hypothetical protein